MNTEFAPHTAFWYPATQPPKGDGPPHFAITVLGVIDDEMLRVNGEEPFVDIVSYWPALQRWTTTHCCRASEEVTDYPVNVLKWIYLPVVM